LIWLREHEQQEVASISLLKFLQNKKHMDSMNEPDYQCVVNYQKGTVYCPLEGTAIPLEEVSDPAFSQGILGPGVAIKPLNGNLYAPVNGTVIALFPTNHALGMMSEDGMELLLHIGIDTVVLNGEGFQAHVKQGDKVRVGQKLISFSPEKIEARGLEATTMVLVSNHQSLGAMEIMPLGAMQPMQPIIRFT